MNHSVNIEPLKGRDNYQKWRIAIKAILDLEDLWEGVVILKPGEIVHHDKDRKAKNKMILTIDSSCYIYISHAESASEVWECLANAFEDKSLSRIVYNLTKITNTKRENCESMAEYVNEILKASDALRDIGVDLGEKVVSGLLLVGLPSE